ncbi:hypothetical protein [Ruegeria conchae]|uniref:hypothetical protein n=1 Tax=Ruegeria conchae TaxID=981384 RepID=UPI00068221AA|nr:hypothetical protein [Ruegeria conchae]
MKATDGKTNEHLARLAICVSEECLSWVEERVVRLQPSLSGTLSLSRSNTFFMGGVKSLENADYRTAVGLAVEILCKATVPQLELADDKIQWVDYT